MSGDANFVMTATRLTIGGFTQPGVARNLIDMPSNSEKGLSHRFIKEVQRNFVDELGV